MKIDKSMHDYYMRLTTLFGQYRGVAVDYNQLVKFLMVNFSEKKAMALLFKLEQATLLLAKIQQQVIELTREFDEKYLKL